MTRLPSRGDALDCGDSGRGTGTFTGNAALAGGDEALDGTS